MEDLSLHILDIVENSVTAGADMVRITVSEDTEKDLLLIEISDNGSGMSDAVLSKADDPFFTKRTTRRVGLGLSLLRQAAEMAHGTFSIKSKEGEGTLVRASFQHSHIDRQPLGNITETMETLVIGNSSVDFCYAHVRNGRSSTFDTREVRRELGDAPLSSPKGIRMVREYLERSQKSLLEANSK